jgi:tRNA-binding protein
MHPADPSRPSVATIPFEVFQTVKMQVGVVVAVDDFPEARKPAYRVTLYFGPEHGQKQSSVQATNYDKTALLGMQVVCATNLPVKKIAGLRSEVLILGVPGEDGLLSLLTPSRKAALGGRVY